MARVLGLTKLEVYLAILVDGLRTTAYELLPRVALVREPSRLSFDTLMFEQKSKPASILCWGTRLVEEVSEQEVGRLARDSADDEFGRDFSDLLGGVWDQRVDLGRTQVPYRMRVRRSEAARVRKKETFSYAFVVPHSWLADIWWHSPFDRLFFVADRQYPGIRHIDSLPQPTQGLLSLAFYKCRDQPAMKLPTHQ